MDDQDPLVKRWFVYVLMNAQGLTYTGVTFDVDPERRLAQHNGQRPGGAKFTRARKPWHLVYVESGFENRAQAQSREYGIKKDRQLKAALKALHPNEF